MNNIFAITPYINNYAFFNGQILEKLTPLQKKVGVIVLAVLAGLAAVYTLYCYWKASKVVPEAAPALPKKQEKQTKEVIKVKEVEKIIHTKKANEIKQEAKKPKVEVAQQIPETKPVERENSVPEELKKEVQELLETVNTCLEKMTRSIINTEFKAENKWNNSLYEFVMTLCRFTNIEVCLNLKDGLRLLKTEEELVELKLKPKIYQLAVDSREKLIEIIGEFNLAVDQMSDCCLKLEPKHVEKLFCLHAGISLEKKIAFIKEFQFVCGNKGKHIKEICEMWFQQVDKMKQKKDKIHNEYTTLLNGVPRDKIIEAHMKMYNIKEKNFLEVQQKLDGMMQALQEVYGKIDRIMEIGEHLLKFYETLDKQEILDATL